MDDILAYLAFVALLFIISIIGFFERHRQEKTRKQLAVKRQLQEDLIEAKYELEKERLEVQELEETRKRELLNREKDKRRKAEITKFRSEWGDDTCKAVYAGKVWVGMSKDMLYLSQGEPKEIDQQEATSNYKKERWVYGVIRGEISYFWLKDDVVTKFKLR